MQERKFWSDYMHAFVEAIAATVSKHRRGSSTCRQKVAAAIVEAIASLNLAYPKLDAEKKKELAAARVALFRER